MSCRRAFSLCSLTILVCTSLSCGRKQDAGVVRLAVVPFENLSSDATLNWAGRAAASALVYDLAPARQVQAMMAGTVSGALSTTAGRMLEGYLVERNGRLELMATLEDLGRARTVASLAVTGPAGEGVLPLVNQIAKQIDGGARSFATAKVEAFRDFGQALESSGDLPTTLAALEAASSADPHFAPADLSRAQLLIANGRGEEGVEVLKLARAANPNAIDAAEIDYSAATVAGDAEARGRALETLTRLEPANMGRFRELADLRFSQRRFQDAARNYEAATRIAPDEAENWNLLGYAYSLAGDLAKSREALEEYARLSGAANSNALDSLGEVHFFAGDFSTAEKYFAQAQKDGPRRGEELMKQAEARLMTGDLAGADGIFQQYLRLIQPAQPKVVGFEQARWDFWTGRRKAGMARMEQLIPKLEGDQQAVALCQLAIWRLEIGSAGARELAEQATTLAQSPRARELVSTSRVIAGLEKGGSSGRIGDAYALIFAKKFGEALPLLEAIYRETNPTVDGQIRTLLAWAELRTGKVGEARRLVETYPIPLSTGDPMFASLVFPRFLYVRGVMLEKEGRSAEAKACVELWRKYSGDVPDIFTKGDPN